jgi:hypothetical protein
MGLVPDVTLTRSALTIALGASLSAQSIPSLDAVSTRVDRRVIVTIKPGR